MTNRAKSLTLNLLRAYKWAISPLMPPSCRYFPTCSEYAIEAVERHGTWRGTTLAAWRLLRCHPFAKGGYDPVPLEKLTNHHHCAPDFASSMLTGTKPAPLSK